MPSAGGRRSTIFASLTGIPVPIGLNASDGGASFVYWGTVQGQVARGAVDGGTPVTLFAPTGAPPFFPSLEVTSDGVFALNETLYGDAGNIPNSGSILRIGLDGGTPTTLVSGLNTPEELVVNGGMVYWTAIADAGSPHEAGTSSVARPSHGGPSTLIVGGQNMPAAIATDGQYLYWGTAGAIIRAKMDGSEASTLATTPGAFELVLDATSLYWTVNSAGTVMKIYPR